MNNYIFLLNRLFLCALILLLFSCGGKTDKSTAMRQDIASLSCVVLLPTEIPYDESAAYTIDKGDLLDGSKFLDNTLKSELDQSQVEKIIDPLDLMPQIREISGGITGVIKVIGDKTQCNNVLMPTLSKFKQRQGSGYAADEPASAAFELRLMEADSGKTIWNGAFNETQASLFDNLFAYGKARSRGFKWITVEELVAQAVEEKIKGCPYLY